MSKFYRAGGAASDTDGELVTLNACVPTSGNVCSFKQGASAYQVPAGKKLIITRVQFGHYNANTGNTGAIGYCDNDVGTNTTTARTNPVSVMGDPESIAAVSSAVGFYHYNPQATSALDNINKLYNTCYSKSVPAGKYLYLRQYSDLTTYNYIAIQCILIAV